MARFGIDRLGEQDGHLCIEEVHPGFVEVFFVPGKLLLQRATLSIENPESHKTKLLGINAQDSYIEIYPINTFGDRPNFLKQKYQNIQSIVLSEYDVEIPASEEDVQSLLEDLPSAFIKDYEFGLGLQKDYRFIIHAIEEIEGVTSLILTDGFVEMIKVEDEICFCKYSLFDQARKQINRVSTRSQVASRITKSFTAHNLVAYYLDNPNYPQKAFKLRNGSLERMIAQADANYREELTEQEKDEVIERLSENRNSIAKTQPKKLIKLKNELELVSLEELIHQYELNLSKKLSEAHWQALFSNNPFILSLAFGYPTIKIRDQAFVGGRKISGSGDSISDFLSKNALTNNTCLFEIKKPGTKLLNQAEYRDGIYTPSSEFSGAITQLSDQIYKFQKNISSLKEDSKLYDIETFAVHGLLVAGVTPSDPVRQKSFELFRSNSKNILVITFDELLEKLKQLHKFLSEDTCT